MVSRTFSVLFRLKKPLNYFKGPQPIYLRITVDGERVELSTQRECEPTKWNSAVGRGIGTKEDIKLLNGFLECLQRKVYENFQTLLEEKEIITAEKIKSRLLGCVEKPKMIIEIFKDHNDKIKELVGNGYAPLTYKRYNTSLEHTKEFIKLKFKKSDFEILKLNYEFIAEYEHYLRTIRKCGHNSTMKYLSNFKKVVLLCVKKGWLSRDPFYGFNLAKKQVNRQFLTQQELNQIELKEFSTSRINIVRDIFLFSCYTGLAYVDVYKLRRSEIRIGIDGEQWIFISRQKTEDPCPIPLLPVCIKILKRYEEHLKCLNDDRALPVWSNQKMNEYLKEIADVCGITKLLTYHLARHTFATTVTLNNGVPIETVAKMLGHRSLRTTQHYAKILHKKISEDMLVLKNRLNDARNQ